MESSSTKETADMDIYDLDSIRIRMEEIASATNNFADENIIAQGSYATVYKGELLQSGDLIDIAVRKSLQTVEDFFRNNVVIYLDIKHKNIISLLKFDGDRDDHLFTIHKYEVNRSLDNHLGGTTLSWMQRLHICVGVAHALRYLHFGLKDDDSVIHGNIKSSKILLDHNWEPKLHDFRCARKVKRHHIFVTHEYHGTLQYKDPAFDIVGGLTHKSDVFSFGVLLFEVLFGMKASIQEGDNYQHFAKMAKLHYVENRLDDMIDPDLRKQMDTQSLKLFSETAYFCLKKQRAERPDMEQIVKLLEKALESH